MDKIMKQMQLQVTPVRVYVALRASSVKELVKAFLRLVPIC